MKMAPILTLALMSATMIPGVQQVHAATKVVDGVISDTMCGRKHMFPGKTESQCIQECMKGTASYALVTAAKIYTLTGKPETIAPFAGKHVHVEGNLKDSAITVTSIHAMQQDMQHDMPM